MLSRNKVDQYKYICENLLTEHLKTLECRENKHAQHDIWNSSMSASQYFDSSKKQNAISIYIAYSLLMH
jgi:hypothetical protein